MCVPGLHVSLGLFFRVFSLLEDKCHMLDVTLTSKAHTNIEEALTSKPFQDYWSNCDNQSKLEKDLYNAKKEFTAAEQLITFFSILQNEVQMQACQDAAVYYKRLIVEIVSFFNHHKNNLKDSFNRRKKLKQ